MDYQGPVVYTTSQLSDAVRELERHMKNDQACTPWALFSILERQTMNCSCCGQPLAAATAATDLAAAALRASAARTVNDLGPAMETLNKTLKKHKQFLPKPPPPAWLDQGMDIDTPPSTPVEPEEANEERDLDRAAAELSRQLPFSTAQVRKALTQAEKRSIPLHKACDLIVEGQRSTGNGLVFLIAALPMLAQEEE